jgi:hypothetical protein
MGRTLVPLVLLAVACGSSNKTNPSDAPPDVAIDAPKMIDAGSNGETLTQFVVNLVLNVSASSTPAAFSTFSALPDPDGTNNNTAAYAVLF